MTPTYKVSPDHIFLKDCPLEIYYEGNKLSENFTFEELSGYYHNINKYGIYLGEGYLVWLYQLTGIKKKNTFSLYPIHHQSIYDDVEYLYVFPIPRELGLKSCLIPGTTWYHKNEDDLLFQVVPSILEHPNITAARD